jgi:predicted transcriptional regulator
MVDLAPREPDLYVVARLLERLWREGAPMLRTRLQVAANLNYDVFTKYLGWLHGKGLVVILKADDGRDRVQLTPKGEHAFGRLVSWLDDFVKGGGAA